ncbi:hypothetical protein [Rufibacter quisquiliarum]|uniref:Metallohydrolase n=1 Tax=Rufibacter quisquiliarum TaxID=1549639 RepID=A0A839GHH0_9BACT|nr:hypothetical protein [Rufibacter quisquiliarum]MBA9077083.1 hypothetical protein [Rufibacter quisquiliarum]
MSEPQYKVYPVGNGDTSLVTLSDETTILVDCNICNDAEDNDDRFDVKADLLEVLRRDEKDRPHLDTFILTHPDQDHCRGFKDTFHTGDPDDYNESDEERDAIIIDELWFSETLFNRFKAPLSEAAKNFKKEAKRRKDLYKKDKSKAQEPGNRLKIIDFKDNEDNKELINIIIEPGTATNNINNSDKNDFSIFVHAPFKTPTEDSQDRNETSVILQMRFKVGGKENAGLLFFAGDADYNRFARLLKDRNDADLNWDIFLAPHHCSWTYFNMTPYEDNTTPQDSSIEFLDKRMEGAWVISSSKKIVDDEDNPPHYPAQQEYKKKVKENFLVTMDKPLETIVFTISSNGPVKQSEQKSKSGSKAATIGIITSTPKTYG